MNRTKTETINASRAIRANNEYINFTYGKRTVGWILAMGCMCILSCNHTHKNHIDRVTLTPGQSKSYSFSTKEALRIGILIDHEVTGGLVELRQVGAVGTLGTSVYWASTQWPPINGKIELTLTNNSKEKVTVTVFQGHEPK